MAQGAAAADEADRWIELLSERAPADAGSGRSVRLLVWILLLAGWASLLVFSALILSEDVDVRPERARADGFDAPLDPVARAGSSTDRSRAAAPATAPSPGWNPVPMHGPPTDALPDAVPPAETAQAAGGMIEGGAPDRARAAAHGPEATPRTDRAPVERAAYVGTWGPNAVACRSRARRDGYLPATITEQGARAGDTLCRFRGGRRDGSGWTMAAECSEGGRRWTSQVRLVVDGNRLTWSSAQGASSYIRCGRNGG